MNSAFQKGRILICLFVMTLCGIGLSAQRYNNAIMRPACSESTGLSATQTPILHGYQVQLGRDNLLDLGYFTLDGEPYEVPLNRNVYDEACDALNYDIEPVWYNLTTLYGYATALYQPPVASNTVGYKTTTSAFGGTLPSQVNASEYTVLWNEVDWGDGTVERYRTVDSLTHTYNVPDGTYQVQSRIGFRDGTTIGNVFSITIEGGVVVNNDSAFQGVNAPYRISVPFFGQYYRNRLYGVFDADGDAQFGLDGVVSSAPYPTRTTWPWTPSTRPTDCNRNDSRNRLITNSSITFPADSIYSIGFSSQDSTYTIQYGNETAIPVPAGHVEMKTATPGECKIQSSITISSTGKVYISWLE